MIVDTKTVISNFEKTPPLHMKAMNRDIHGLF